MNSKEYENCLGGVQFFWEDFGLSVNVGRKTIGSLQVKKEKFNSLNEWENYSPVKFFKCANLEKKIIKNDRLKYYKK